MPTQTPVQAAAATQDAGLNTNQASSVNAGKGYTGSAAAISADSLNETASPINLPPTPPPTDPFALNKSIPTPAAIIKDANTPTAAEGQQSGTLQDIATKTGTAKSLATYQLDNENAAGLPGMRKTVNDLSVQLNGLTDHLDYLNNVAPTTIANQEQQNVQGRGVTTGGLAPINTGDLRNNQIQAATVAAQSLTIKAALYAAQGNLSLAQAAADKSAQVQFDAQQQQLTYEKSLLDSIQPQLDKDQAARAATVSAELADRQKAIDLQIENYKTGQAAVADALKNNPNDAQAHYAAMQAMKLDAHDPQYLSKVQALVGPYATDLTKRALDMQLERAQIANIGVQKQDTYEQQFRTALEKEFSSRSGSLGTQATKVDAAIHLRTLFDQYKDANGNYQVPPAQYAELAQGMAALVSGNNSLSDSRVADIQSASAKGDLAKALQYATGQTFTGSSQGILKNLSDSIDRQGQVSEQLRDQYVKRLEGLAPTGLNADRRAALISETLPSYTEAKQGKYNPQASQAYNPGDTFTNSQDGFTYRVNADGKTATRIK